MPVDNLPQPRHRLTWLHVQAALWYTSIYLSFTYILPLCVAVVSAQRGGEAQNNVMVWTPA